MQVLGRGWSEFDHKMSDLRLKMQKQIVKKSITAGVRVSVKAMKSDVPAKFKEAKKAIGFKVKVKSPDQVTAKAGIGVGMTRARRGKAISKALEKRATKGKRKGVGISVANAFWFILGTAQRTTGTIRTGSHAKGAISPRKFTGKPVHSTGQMKPQMDPVKSGYIKSEGLALQAMRTAARSLIAIAMRGTA